MLSSAVAALVTFLVVHVSHSERLARLEERMRAVERSVEQIHGEGQSTRGKP
jgi:hypothetical protein